MSEAISFSPAQIEQPELLTEGIRLEENGLIGFTAYSPSEVAIEQPSEADDLYNHNAPTVDLAESARSMELPTHSVLDRARSKGRRLAAGVLTTAVSIFGGTEAAMAQTIDTPARRALEQRYNNYTGQFKDQNPEYVMRFEDFFSSNEADYVCGSPYSVLGQAVYGLVGRKLSIEVGRKSAIYSKKVVMMTDPATGKQIWQKLSVPCSDLVENEASIQLYHQKEKTVKGKRIKSWERIPGTKSVKLPDWQPNAVRNEASDDPAINPVLVNVTKLALKVPKVNRAPSKVLSGAYPAIVLHSKSKISTYESKTATVLPRIPKRGSLSVNAGAKRYGKGAPVATVGFDSYPGYK